MAKKSTEEMRLYMRGYRERRRAEAKQSLGGVCNNCGGTDNLEFDHVDRTTKVDGIANLITHAKTTLNTELEKCQLLCATCHYEKSLAAGDLVVAQHGSTTLYGKGCRCDPCVVAQRTYRRSYYLENGR